MMANAEALYFRYLAARDESEYAEHPATQARARVLAKILEHEWRTTYPEHAAQVDHANAAARREANARTKREHAESFVAKDID